MLLLPPPPPLRRAWMDGVDGRPATCSALDVSVSVARATAGARRPRRSLAAYPMNADASKAREAVSAVRSRHLRSAADVLASRRESVCLLTRSRALFDSALQCARCNDCDGRGIRGPPPSSSRPMPRSRRRRVTLPICAAERENAESGIWTPNASTAVVCSSGGSWPLASRPRLLFSTAAPAAERDVRAGGGLVGSGTRAAERRRRNAAERSETEENDDARTVRFRLASMQSEPRSGGRDCSSAIGYAVATHSNSFTAATFASPPNDLAAFAAFSEREEPVTMPDGLSLTPPVPEKRAAGRVPVTRMYRDRPSLTREQVRKLQLIAKLEDRELDSLKTIPAASRQQPQLQPLPLSDDDESELSSDRSQAGSRMETMKERHWVDDVTVSSGSEHCTHEESAAPLDTTGTEETDSELIVHRLPPCICPSSEEKSRLYCVKKWLVKTNFDMCSKAIPLL